MRMPSQRRQPRFDLGAAILEEGRQRQALAELVERLVGSETGPIGGDLEEDAVRLAKIETLKVEPIYLAAVGDAHFAKPPRPGVVFLLVRRAEGDVVDGAGALDRGGEIGLDRNMEFGGRPAIAHLVDMDDALAPIYRSVLADPA